ncbi:MAG: VOC family protein [Alphaproteobacteria bacterium]|nr:MAG: VOC family protein [Alphaproteobacteria bacterium]
MLDIKGIHHIAVICSDYERSRHFFTTILGCEIIAETYREQRKSYKLDLRVDANTQIELFSFPEPPKRTSRPEACGLRHLAFAVDDLDKACDYLRSHDIEVEPIRTDELTGKCFTFFADPDDLPLELYES